MGKKKKNKHHSLMRDWPTDNCVGIQYDNLIFPLKKIMHEGYRLERLPTKQFVYTGYNIGLEERMYFPTPEERFSTRWLENEAKFKRTLMDNILVTVFQLGIEQGRRGERPNRYSNVLLEDILQARTRKIKQLRAKLAEYDEAYRDDETPVPLETDDDSLLIDNMDVEVLDNVDIQSPKEG
jgi:hypothetical protein